MRKTASTHILLTLALVMLTVPSFADWPQRRGPMNDGISTETHWSHDWPEEGPRVLWKGSVGIGFSAVAISSYRAFTIGNFNDQDAVVCLNAMTGEALWKFAYPEPLNPKMYEGGPNSTPTVSDDKLLVVSRTGKLLCLQKGSGTLVWSNNLAVYVEKDNGNWGAGGSPVVRGSNVFVNYGSAMVAVDLSSGRAVWQSAKDPKGKHSFTSAVFSSDSSDPILLAHMNKALFALAPADGRELWRHPFGSGYETHATDPVITSTGVFISSGDDGGELISFSSGKETRLWKNKNLGTFTGTAVLVGRHLYGVDSGSYKKGKQELRCVDLEKGEVKWSLPGFGQDSLIAAGDRLIVLTERGELVIAKAVPDQGRVLARAQVIGGKCWTQPTLSDGLLYCRNARGQVVCLDLRKPGA